MTIAVLLSLVLSGLLAAASAYLARSWQERDITLYRWSIPVAAGAASLAGCTAAVLTKTTVTLVAASVTALTFIVILSALSDLASGKMPRELAWAGSILGVIISAIAPLPMVDRLGVVFAVAVTAGVPYLLWFLGKGIGMGDIRLLATIALLTAWWAGPLAPLGVYILATLLQVVFRLVLPSGLRASLRLSPEEEAARYPFGPALAIGTLVVTVLALVLR